MQDLNVSLVQVALAWEDYQKNIDTLEDFLGGMGASADLVVLPEMFTSGFTMNAAANAQTMDGPGVAWMKRKARELDADVTGSMIIREGDQFFNRLIWVKPSGEEFTYDKKHLFRYSGEHQVYTPGDALVTVELKGWKLRPFICYDLRFPLWLRNVNNRYDAAVIVANWPSRRAAHWRALLMARAIENQAYVIGVNRVGSDGNSLEYSGDSTVIGPMGEVLFHSSEESICRSVTLSQQALEDYRNAFPAWMDADADIIAQPL